MITRRSFLGGIAASGMVLGCGCAVKAPNPPRSKQRLFFTSKGRTFVIGADGTGLRALEVERSGQVTWQPAGFLEDGRVLMLSMEARRDGPGRPFDEYYHQTPTHVWAHDLDTGSLEELATRDRVAAFYAPQLVEQEDLRNKP